MSLHSVRFNRLKILKFLRIKSIATLAEVALKSHARVVMCSSRVKRVDYLEVAGEGEHSPGSEGKTNRRWQLADKLLCLGTSLPSTIIQWRT